MAPPCSSSFSVRVVLPASGCEMMAKVRRLAISCRSFCSGSTVLALREWWTCPGSNRRPLECDSSALPAELQAHSSCRKPRRSGEIRPERGALVPFGPGEVKHGDLGDTFVGHL